MRALLSTFLCLSGTADRNEIQIDYENCPSLLSLSLSLSLMGWGEYRYTDVILREYILDLWLLASTMRIRFVVPFLFDCFAIDEWIGREWWVRFQDVYNSVLHGRKLTTNRDCRSITWFPHPLDWKSCYSYLLLLRGLISIPRFITIAIEI